METWNYRLNFFSSSAETCLENKIIQKAYDFLSRFKFSYSLPEAFHVRVYLLTDVTIFGFNFYLNTTTEPRDIAPKADTT